MKIDSTTISGWTVEIHADEDPESPRDWTHGAELVLSMRNYDLPNDANIDFADFEGWQEVETYLREELGALYVEDVWGYSHSGIAFKSAARTYPFDDRWDSGQAGLAYVTPQNWKDCQGEAVPWTGSEGNIKVASEMIKSDVDVYTQYVQGDVYGYVITDPADDELQDSCWGFYGFEDVEAAAKDAAECLEHEPKCNGELNRRTGLVEHDEDGCPVHCQRAASCQQPAGHRDGCTPPGRE